jgi:hypothetical protein
MIAHNQGFPLKFLVLAADVWVDSQPQPMEEAGDPKWRVGSFLYGKE